MFSSPELAELGSGQVSNGRSPNIFAERTIPIAVNSTSISNGVAEPSDSTSYQMPWSADSITAAAPLSSDSSHCTGAQSPLSSPSSSRYGRGPPCPISNEKTWSSDLIPDLKRHSTGRSSTTLVTRSSIASPINGPHGDGVELFRPEVPVLVIFTMCRARYTFLHIKREQHLCPKIFSLLPDLQFSNPTKESSRAKHTHQLSLLRLQKSRKACTRAVMESKTKKRAFTVHRYSA